LGKLEADCGLAISDETNSCASLARPATRASITRSISASTCLAVLDAGAGAVAAGLPLPLRPCLSVGLLVEKS